MNLFDVSALDYAARGWPVLPLHSVRDGRCTCNTPDCGSPGKHPRTLHGLKDATTDAKTVESWWRTWPDANIGILTGAPSGLIVLDVDPRHGGDATLDDLLTAHGPLPDTVESLTGGGGRHIFFRHPGGTIKSGAGRLGAGLDVKAEGGYVVTPPSVHVSGKSYQWELSSDPGEVPPADAPPWLLALLQDTPAPAAAVSQGGRIVDGQRGATLASLAGSMRRRGMTEAAILAALQADNRARCNPPLPDGKVAAIAKSIGRYPPAASPWTRSTGNPARTAPPQWRPFPVEALPQACRSYVRELAAATETDPSYAALALLVGLAGAIGNTRRIRVKSDWIAPAVLWAALVGESGRLKTVVLKHVLAPVYRREGETVKEHRAALDQYKAAMQAHKYALRDWERDGRAAGAPAPVEPSRPILERHLVSDTTVEALADRLQDAPRGVLLARDELAGWLRSFNQYKATRGADEAHWAEMFEASNLLVDRKVGERATVCVPCAAVSIVGGIQPDILRRSLMPEYRESGLAARLLMAWPRRKPKRWTERELSASAVKRLSDIYARLWTLAPVEVDGELGPLDLTLSADAKTLFADFVNRHGQEAMDLAGDLGAAWAKLEGYGARLALVLELVAWAEGLEGDGRGPTEISAASVRDSLQIVEWAKSETRRIYTMLDESDEEKEAREVLDFVQRRGGRVTAYDLHKGMPKRFPDSDDADLYLRGFVPSFGHWVEAPPGPKGGRPTRFFELNDAPVVESPKPETP